MSIYHVANDVKTMEFRCAFGVNLCPSIAKVMVYVALNKIHSIATISVKVQKWIRPSKGLIISRMCRD